MKHLWTLAATALALVAAALASTGSAGAQPEPEGINIPQIFLEDALDGGTLNNPIAVTTRPGTDDLFVGNFGSRSISVIDPGSAS